MLINNIRADVASYMNNTNRLAMDVTLKSLNFYLPGIYEKIDNLLYKNYKYG